MERKRRRRGGFSTRYKACQPHMANDGSSGRLRVCASFLSIWQVERLTLVIWHSTLAGDANPLSQRLTSAAPAPARPPACLTGIIGGPTPCTSTSYGSHRLTKPFTSASEGCHRWSHRRGVPRPLWRRSGSTGSPSGPTRFWGSPGRTSLARTPCALTSEGGPRGPSSHTPEPSSR